MTAAPAYLVNTVNAVVDGSSMPLRAGKLLNTQAQVDLAVAAGGQVWPASDPIVAGAAAQVTKLQARGANEADVAAQMAAAIVQSLAATAGPLAVNFSAVGGVGATGQFFLSPFPVGKAGKLTSALTATFAAVAGAGESAVLQVKKNGSNVSGATYTYDATKSALVKTPIVIPNTLGLAYAATDYLEVAVTYTAGGSPALTGEAANASFAATGGPA